MNILYLVHRIPFPPDKGDKIRSYHWLRALASKHDVHLVTLYDDPADAVHESALEKICASVTMLPLSPKRARLRSLSALVRGGPLSVPYFGDAVLKRKVAELRSRIAFDLVVAYSAPMAAYREGLEDRPFLMDMVDVDSAKFAAYGRQGKVPMKWIHALEAKRLARYEEQLVRDADVVLLCTEPEADLLRNRVTAPPGSSLRVEALANGVELPPESRLATEDELRDAADRPHRFVFVGAMDYYANVDAVVFAAREIMPRLREKIPDALFEIVGRHPTAEVRALDSLPGVSVLGGVPDVGDYLKTATASLVPLRIAQGIQNKVLEAMAWRIPVVTHPKIVRSLGADAGDVVRGAESVEEYTKALCELVADLDARREVGRASRRFVEEHFSWEPNYERLLSYVDELTSDGGAAS